ncbi:hypothetical protein J6590_058404 [Homalodisca vitripennis]|nr:hypothetical protein J6590_058404 [Homalodisca vitripennis]
MSPIHQREPPYHRQQYGCSVNTLILAVTRSVPTLTLPPGDVSHTPARASISPATIVNTLILAVTRSVPTLTLPPGDVSHTPARASISPATIRV